MKNRSKSRKRTPWDNNEELTATEEYVKMHYVARYEERHPKLKDAGESNMINSYKPTKCPYCGSEHFIQKDYDAIGIQRYRCECSKYFKATTGTIFDSRKIPISEWIEYCLNIFRYVSLNADSWNDRNAISTSKYWLEKLFLTIENTHRKLVEKLSLNSICYTSKDMKGLADSEDPLAPVNRIHCLLKMFLNAHSGFCRDDLQNYLNLYAFVINPPSDHLGNVMKIINLVFQNPKSLKYREQFG